MKKTPVSLGVAAASAAIARAAHSVPHDELIRRVRASLELALGTLGKTHRLVIQDVKGEDGKVTGVTMIGRAPICQLTYIPEVSTGDAVFHTSPLTDATLVAALVSIAADALASIPGNPVQLQCGGPIAAVFEDLGNGMESVRFTQDYHEILDELVKTADTLPALFREMRERVKGQDVKHVSETEEAKQPEAAEAAPA
ncbi:hypothetical protein [Delftia phage PhiW-14]|uniref:Uncharacterized protein n=1 Tax=Delftia phage PhiW-14 TaxID=665032 RepID=C9DFZ7_BPW14|nr:hypothetical protein DP-phiW-14_gp025 [Delftia phage PhiW-14]ACV50048.1 hypothetical protein [Delftia phage PhiW-14]